MTYLQLECLALLKTFLEGVAIVVKTPFFPNICMHTFFVIFTLHLTSILYVFLSLHITLLVTSLNLLPSKGTHQLYKITLSPQNMPRPSFMANYVDVVYIHT